MIPTRSRFQNRSVSILLAGSSVLAVVLTLASLSSPSPAAASPQETDKPSVPAGDAVEGESEGRPQLPAGVYARVNGRDVSQREYAEFLLASIGKAHLDRYIDRILIETEARKQSVTVTPDEVEKLLEERIQRTVQGIYRGNRKAFLETLARRHSSLEERKQRDRQDIYFARLLEGVILKSRTVDEKSVQAEFERVYGPQGVQYDLRHLLVSTGRRIGADGESLSPRTAAQSSERAGKVHKELLGGADFVELVKRYCDDPFTRQNDGRIPLYRKGLYGAEFDAAVEKLTKESPLSGLVRSTRGWHLVQLVDRRVTKLEDVRGEVQNLVRHRPPTAKEKQDALRALREAARIVR